MDFKPNYRTKEDCRHHQPRYRFRFHVIASLLKKASECTRALLAPRFQSLLLKVRTTFVFMSRVA
jgi:hypothetical protein